jgi:hypothetical protein
MISAIRMTATTSSTVGGSAGYRRPLLRGGRSAWKPLSQCARSTSAAAPRPDSSGVLVGQRLGPGDRSARASARLSIACPNLTGRLGSSLVRLSTTSSGSSSPAYGCSSATRSLHCCASSSRSRSRSGSRHCVSRSYGVWPFGRAVVPRDNHILQKCEPTWNAFLSDVRAFLGEDKLARTDAGDIGELTDREREVFELGRQGMSNEQIAERL